MGDDSFYLGLFVGSTVSLLFSVGAICLSSYFRGEVIYVIDSPRPLEESDSEEDCPKTVIEDSDDEKPLPCTPRPSSSSVERLSKREEIAIVQGVRGFIGMKIDVASILLQETAAHLEFSPKFHLRKKGTQEFPPLEKYDPYVLTIATSTDDIITYIYGIGGVY